MTDAVLALLSETFPLDAPADAVLAPAALAAAAAAGEDFLADSDRGRALRRVAYPAVCTLLAVGVNSVARALESKELCLVLLCIPVRALIRSRSFI